MPLGDPPIRIKFPFFLGPSLIGVKIPERIEIESGEIGSSNSCEVARD
jgi:hypothetical protein